VAAYALKCSHIGFGITPRCLRILAYQVAPRNKITYPPSWDEKQCAGKDWYCGFMKRSAFLSLRTPLSCSLARAASFNMTNVNLFFDNLQKLLIKYHNFQDVTRIFNLDETSTTTVPHRNPKVIAGKKCKLVVQSSSAERGILVTTCCFISAGGSFLPPAMIFPRKKFKRHMLNKAVPGTLGLAQKSGW
jgi:hypothetical protein